MTHLSTQEDGTKDHGVIPTCRLPWLHLEELYRARKSDNGTRATCTDLILKVKLTLGNQHMYAEKTFLHNCNVSHLQFSF